MADESSFATLGDLNREIKKITDRQDAYEKSCEEDRQRLHGKVDALKESMERIENLLKPISAAFKNIIAKPTVQGAFITMILAASGYLTYKLHEMTPPTPPTNHQPIIVIPQNHADGGVPSVTVQAQ